MTRSNSCTQLLFSAGLVLAGLVSPAAAQWDLWDPWRSGSMYNSYYPPSFYGGYSAGYAPTSAYYGPAPYNNCGCQPSCDPCGSCGSGGCASGNCSMNAAPPGSPRPIAEPNGTGSYGKDAPVPGRGNSGTNRGGTKTFEESDPSRFEEPDLNTAPKPKPFPSNRTGTDTKLPKDDFERRNDGLGSDFPGDPDAAPARRGVNKPELNGPDLPEVPEKAPAGPVNVEEEAPKDAALGLDSKITNRPVLMRDRFVSRSRSSAPSVARTPSRPTRDWSAAPVTARIVR